MAGSKKRTEQEIRQALTDILAGNPVHSDKWPEDDSDKILLTAIDELLLGREILESVRSFCFSTTALMTRK